MILQKIKQYLLAKDFEYIFRETLPDMPDCAIGLFLKDSDQTCDGGMQADLTVVVRQGSADDAFLTATEISAYLDSGINERMIKLTKDSWCISSPCGYPVNTGPDGRGRGLAEIKFKVFFNIKTINKEA